ncbi:hypothetical protein PIB30_112234, partial [Stylosanthes scabra]|nr:hypothetical protein [Stylosanthes scabra]
IIEKERERLLLLETTKHHLDSRPYTMSLTSTRCFPQEGAFRNSSFKRMRMSLPQSDTKSTIGSGKSSQSLSNGWPSYGQRILCKCLGAGQS